MAELTIEQQRAVALARARRRRAEAPPKAPGAPEELTFAEKYIAPMLEKVQQMPVVGAPLRADEQMIKGMVQGGADAPVGVAQMIANIGGPGEIDKAIRKQQADYEASRGADAGSFDPSRMAGNLVGPLAMMTGGAGATTGVLGRLGQAAGVGAASATANPVAGEDFWTEKGGQALMGGVLGPLLPGAWELGKAGGRTLRNLVQPLLGRWGAERAGGRIARNVAGARTDAVVDALMEAKERVPGSMPTAGQASVPANSAEFAALQEIAASKKPSLYAGTGRSGEQQGARAAAMHEIAGTPDELKAAKAARKKEATDRYGEIAGTKISPKSEADLMVEAIENRAAAKGSALQDKGRFDTFSAQNEVRGANFEPVPGQPRVSGRASNFPERAAEGRSASADAQAAYLARRGEEDFLRQTMETLKETVGLDEKALYPLLNRPSMKEALKASMRSAEEKGSYFPSKPGDKFSIDNLQRMKMALDDILKDPAEFGIKASEAVEIGDTRKEFIKWVSNRSPKWRDARLAYAEDSKLINQKVVGAELERALVSGTGKERATAFTNAVEKATSIPDLQRNTGAARFGNIDEVLDPKQMGAVRGVVDDLKNNAAFDDLASAGMPEALRITGEKIPKVGMLERSMMIVNAIMSRLEGRGGKIGMETLADIMRDPKKTAEVMRKAKPFERQEIVDMLMRANAANIGQQIE